MFFDPLLDEGGKLLGGVSAGVHIPIRGAYPFNVTVTRSDEQDPVVIAAED